MGIFKKFITYLYLKYCSDAQTDTIQNCCYNNDFEFFLSSLDLIKSCATTYENSTFEYFIYNNKGKSVDISTAKIILSKDILKIVFDINNHSKDGISMTIAYMFCNNVVTTSISDSYNAIHTTSFPQSICDIEYEKFKFYMLEIIEFFYKKSMINFNAQLIKYKNDKNLNRDINLTAFNDLVENGEL